MDGEVAKARRCENCQAPLSGPYCAACGQRDEPHIHSLKEFISEAAESVTHADSRVWRTLWPLLVKPGFLTREFLEGRRARYLPPFRLYLVLSVIFFLVASGGGHNNYVLLPADTRINDLSDGTVHPLAPPANNPTETPEQRAERICNSSHFGVPFREWLEPKLKEGCKHVVVDNGHELAQQMLHNIPRALFVLLPLLALVMRAMYWRRHYVEHLLFFLHNHAFTFVFFTFYVLAMRFFESGWIMGSLTLALIFLVPYYAYRAMLRVYGQSRWITRSKFVVLTFAYIFCGLLMALLTSLYTVITL
ncbi:MAG TPA: DUF3667 domain-containing protein [Steroidobacteraceae bacterium]|nr:DUF3667 domain-containing protein [Steroidobacteraceae bacterium]